MNNELDALEREIRPNFPPLTCSANRPVTWQYQLDSFKGIDIMTNSVTIFSRPVLEYDESGEHEGRFAVVTLTRAEIADILTILDEDISDLRRCCPEQFFL